ncbi:hypothetical protein QNI19_14565 [Cytophagaceae bacterium DM2B3-1]|uniref:Uncharacterized protein n=1 Tax=Xanthocytophaga flava TaxID=3048013 RepID=A0ABT7CK78_9BACT|nr:hypothetical protein [Xanthocytophaga flavus]MDJ1494163.1 hypothetical protein [Xanthocytophaga flavus]
MGKKGQSTEATEAVTSQAAPQGEAAPQVQATPEAQTEPAGESTSEQPEDKEQPSTESATEAKKEEPALLTAMKTILEEKYYSLQDELESTASKQDDAQEEEKEIDWREDIAGYFDTYKNAKEFWVVTTNKMVFPVEADALHYVSVVGGEVKHVKR